MPTLMGFDSDDERSYGEVGREGVAIDHVDDLHAVLEDIDIGSISVSMTINPSAWLLLAMILVPIDVREDWPPHRHLAGAMPARWQLLAGNNSFQARQRKRPAVARGDAGQVGRLYFERLGRWAVRLGVRAVTRGAICLVQFWAFYGMNQRRLFGLITARALRQSETTH
jgi:hypothetical protein